MEGSLKRLNKGGRKVTGTVIAYPRKKGDSRFRYLTTVFEDSDYTVLPANGGTEIKNILDQLLFHQYEVKRIDSGGNEEPVGEADLGKPIPNLEPGTYEVSFQDREPIKFRIAGNERIVFSLDERALSHEPYPDGRQNHTIAAEECEQDGPSSPRNFLVEGCKENSDGDGIEFVVSLEHGYRKQSVFRPEEIRFEVARKGDTGAYDKPPELMKWNLEPGRSVPTWRIHLPRKDGEGKSVNQKWATDTDCEIRAHWKNQPTRNPSQFIDIANLSNPPQGQPFKGEIEIKTRKVRIHQISKIGAEKLTLEVSYVDQEKLNPAEGREELSRLKLQLWRNDSEQDIKYTTEFYAEDRVLRYSFSLGENQLDEGWKILVTSWADQKQGACEATVKWGQ